MTTRNAVILAAGKGTRLLPMTSYCPKPLIQVNGHSILERCLDNLSNSGVTDVTIVVGYKGDLIRGFGDTFDDIHLTYVENYEYADTNSMFSLLLGILRTRSPTWVIEGDILFERGMLDLPVDGEISWFVDAPVKDVDGAYLITDSDGVVTSLEIVANPFVPINAMKKSVGILHMTEDGAEWFTYWLGVALAEGRKNQYYDLVLQSHLNQKRVKAVDVAPWKWYEVDTTRDLEVATGMFP